jgi:hypothetical protein
MTPTSRYTRTLQELETTLRPYMTQEAVEIGGRFMARLMSRDTRQLDQLKQLFAHAFTQEYQYLQDMRLRTARQHDGAS